MRRGPLAGRYGAAASMVIFALVPYLGLSAALQPLAPMISEQLHMSTQTMSLGLGMANAGYAVGTILAVQFAQLLPQRRMMVLYAILLVIGSVLAASATNSAMFISGHVLQGLCTSLLLIAAVPPLALGFGIEKFRWTAIIMNVCIFGAVALGPVIGGIQASAGGWRPLFWIVAAVALDGAGAVAADLRGRSSGRPGGPARRPRDRAGRRGLRARVLRRLGAHHPRLRGHEDAAAAARGSGADRDPGRLPVPQPPPAADDPHDDHQHHPGGRDRRGPGGRRRIGVGDRPHGRRAGAPLLAPAPGAAVPAGAGRRAAGRGGARRRAQKARDALPAAGRDDLPGSRDRGLHARTPALGRDDPDRLGADRTSASVRPSRRPCSSPGSRSPPRACSGCSRSSSCSARWPPS